MNSDGNAIKNERRCNLVQAFSEGLAALAKVVVSSGFGKRLPSIHSQEVQVAGQS